MERHTQDELPLESIADSAGEALLVARAQCGDLAAFEQLLRKVHGPVRRYVVKLAGESEADDILQEVALKIYRQIRHLREPSVFRAWTFRIATRTAFAYLKKAKRWRELENDPELIRSWAGASANRQEEFDSDFLRLVDRVSPASRAVLLLHYQQHLSLEETAAILDIPVGTAKSRLSYGVGTIRKFVIGGNHGE
ncbi:MAG: sigma-70 family RNA polymerase sigma factor [Bryobacteraceae bacterium]|nr:sigma-70 family RNA polymerase sigma factor [Bryobacteraceae bacterium]